MRLHEIGTFPGTDGVELVVCEMPGDPLGEVKLKLRTIREPKIVLGGSVWLSRETFIALGRLAQMKGETDGPERILAVGETIHTGGDC